MFDANAQDPMFTQFYANPLYLNPALTGVERCPRVITNYRNQWPNTVEGGVNYVTYSASYDQHVDAFSGGLGLQVMNDQSGNQVFNNYYVSGMYSYNLPVNRKLSMRFGLHSGPIVGGVLRGQKSRFELFGDTINVASRMESTGEAGQIQVSAELAQLLRQSDREHWVTPRDGLVFVKGKGDQHTFWLTDEVSSTRRSSVEVISEMDEDVAADETESSADPMLPIV